MIAVCDATGRLCLLVTIAVAHHSLGPGAEIDRSFLAAVHPSDEARIRSYLQDVSNNAGVAAPVEFRLISGGDSMDQCRGHCEQSH